MMADTTIAVIVITVFILSFVCFCCKACVRNKAAGESLSRPQRIQIAQRMQRVRPNQQEDIFNISSRVQGQGQWPTHDAHVSIDNFTISNEINKYNDDPPTYEEAMNLAASNNNVVPAVAPKTTTASTTIVTSTSTPN